MDEPTSAEGGRVSFCTIVEIRKMQSLPGFKVGWLPNKLNLR